MEEGLTCKWEKVVTWEEKQTSRGKRFVMEQRLTCKGKRVVTWEDKQTYGGKRVVIEEGLTCKWKQVITWEDKQTCGRKRVVREEGLTCKWKGGVNKQTWGGKRVVDPSWIFFLAPPSGLDRSHLGGILDRRSACSTS